MARRRASGPQRTLVARLSQAALAILLTAGPANAEPRGRAQAAAETETTDVPVKPPEESDEAADEAGDDTPVVGGSPSAEAVRARTLLDAGRWSEAALMLQRVAAGETGDEVAARQIAEYRLAVALCRLRFVHASYAIFATIADAPEHARFQETLLWLAKLADDLPEPAEVVERLNRYGPDALARLDGPGRRGLVARLGYRLGRSAYRRGAYEEAVRRFEQVPRDSPHALEAQLLAGMAHVQLRRPGPAIRAFQRVVREVEQLERAERGGRPTEEEARLADLAQLSLGRIHYSTAFRLGERGGAAIDAHRLAAARDSFARVRAWSELWQQSLFEQAWVYFMLGDHPRALGQVHSIEAPRFSNRYWPEADVLRATIVYSLCRYDEAIAVATRAWTRYKPVQDQLEAMLAKQSSEAGDAGFFLWAEALHGSGRGREGWMGSLPAMVRAALEQALSGRDVARYVEYVHSIEQEMGRLRGAPASFRGSRLGRDVADSLSLAHDVAIHQGGALVEQRSRRALAELRRHLDDALRVLVSARGRGGRPRAEGGEPIKAVILGEDGHGAWPFDGEYWPDEIGNYRQLVTSRCPR